MGYYVNIDGWIKNVDPASVSSAQLKQVVSMLTRRYNMSISKEDRDHVENVIDQVIKQVGDYEVYDGDSENSFFSYDDKFFDDDMTRTLNALIETNLITEISIDCVGEDKAMWRYEFDSSKDSTWREVDVRKYSDRDIKELIDQKINEKIKDISSYALTNLVTNKGKVEFQKDENSNRIYLNFVPNCNTDGLVYTFASVSLDDEKVIFEIFENINDEKSSHTAKMSIEDMFRYCDL